MIAQWTSRLLLALSVLAMNLVTSCDPPDCVEYEFKWVKTFLPDLDKPFQEDPEWYKAYALTDEQMEKILSTHFKKQGYSEWEAFHDRYFLSANNPVYQLDGYATPTQVCYKDDGSYKFDQEYNFIAMFVETERKRLILVYGITYGR